MAIINTVIAGGSSPVIDPLNVTPGTSAQTITASGGVDGYSPVNVSAVTSSIDANITAGNIKDGVQILGVTGNYTGTTPTGTKSITSNGVYDVTNFASADVQVPTTAPAHYVEKTVDANGKLVNGSSIINLSGVTDVGNYVLAYEYYGSNFPADTTIDLSNITTLSGTYSCESTFMNSRGIMTVNMSGLTSITGSYACHNMFNSASITGINLSALTTVSGTAVCQGMFQACNGLISVDLPNLTTIGGGAFAGTFMNCSNLTSVKMNAINTMTGAIAVSYASVFPNCSKLESVELGGLKASTFASDVNQIQYLFNSSTGRDAPNGCTVHFPSNFDPADPNHTFDASTLAGYPTFGGNASYIHVAFDLPASE